MTKIIIDKNRRENLRKLHSATHILNHSCKKFLGEHVWQNGSNLNEEYGTLDITHYKNLEKDEILQIEKDVNKIIFENRKIEVLNLDRGNAEKKYGYEIYQGGGIPQTKLRIIKIENNDIEACGGLHCKQTSEIQFFKIEDVVKIQDGVLRIKFRVGEFALKLIQENDLILNELKSLYLVSKNDILKSSVKFFEESKTNLKIVNKKKEIIRNLIVQNIKDSKSNYYFINFEIDLNEMILIFEESLCDIESDKFFISKTEKNDLKYKKVIKKQNYLIYIK